MFTGAIIKETITDEMLLDAVEIENVEIWKTDEAIRYWTMIFFRSDAPDFPTRLSRVILEGWYADMKENNTKYIVFKDAVLAYEIGNVQEKETVLDECRRRGIRDDQLGWAE